MKLRPLRSDVVAAVLLAAVVGCSSPTTGPEDAGEGQEQADDWCERAEAWLGEALDASARYRDDPASVTVEDAERTAVLWQQMLSDPVPEEIVPVIDTLRGDLPDDRQQASEEAVAANEVLVAHIEDGCGVDLSEPMVGVP